MNTSQLKFVSALILSIITTFSFGQNINRQQAFRYFELFQSAEYVNIDLAKKYADSGLFFALKTEDPEIIGRAYQFKGWFMQDLSEFTAANRLFMQSLSFFRKAKNEQGIADAFGNLGNAYLDIEDYQKSLDYQLLSLAKNEEILKKKTNRIEIGQAKQGKTFALHNIGTIYSAIGMYDKALEYENKSIPYEKETENERGLAISYNMLASLYKQMEVVDSAIYYYKKALNYSSPNQHPDAYAIILQGYATLKNSGLTKKEQTDMLRQSYEMRSAMRDENGQGLVMLDICENHFDELSKDSLSSLFRSINDLIESNADLEPLKERYYRLYSRYSSKIGDFNQAYFSLENFVDLKAISDEKRREQDLVAGDIKRQWQTKNFNDSIQIANDFAIERAEYHKAISEIQDVVYLSVIGFIILGVSLFIFVSSNRRKRKVNAILSEKNNLIEEKNQSISDSITYAQRLQLAILPTSEQINQFLPESFLYFLPKDIVSGDFYWFEQKNDVAYIAVADCTGHGVPGAMMSIVCSDALSRSMNEFKLDQPAEILNKTRELVIQKFEKSAENVSDGMDIGLIALNLNALELIFAGANNPICIVRKNLDFNQEEVPFASCVQGDFATIIEVKGDKQPIGQYAHLNSFNQHKVKLKKGDQIYLFSDGFADQFGGADGKKFKYVPFKRLLIKIESETMEKQRDILADTFQIWKGTHEQIDDVCVMGIKV